MDNIKLGLVGRNISYSFSKTYFESKFQKLGLKNCSYDLFDLANLEAIHDLFIKENLTGLNVTQPYKVAILPYLDSLSDEAKEIGAVNTVLIKGGKKIGYNTDAFGFEQSFLMMKKDHHKKALILGNGGAAKAVKYVLNKYNIPYKIITRAGVETFENLNENILKEYEIIIQCTPVGTYPNITDHLPFPFQALTSNYLVMDLIYNPKETEFLRKAAHFGAKTMNGQHMLEQQAEKAWQIWHS